MDTWVTSVRLNLNKFAEKRIIFQENDVFEK